MRYQLRHWRIEGNVQYVNRIIQGEGISVDFHSCKENTTFLAQGAVFLVNDNSNLQKFLIQEAFHLARCIDMSQAA
jgi:hypothetical protein